jgi:REP element-mobilizing transposase RayT
MAYFLRTRGSVPDPAAALKSGIHSRGYLPHVKREGKSYFVTFRLADSLPTEVLLGFERERAEKIRHSNDNDGLAFHEADRERQRQIERYLDRGHGACYLRQPQIAKVVVDALRYFEGKQYILDEWVVMPNHVHLVIWPMPNQILSAILQGRKRQSARDANKLLGRTGQAFWQPESYDHWIRDPEEKARIRKYIRQNPVKAGLCTRVEDWSWSSCSTTEAAPSGLPTRDTAD